VSSFSKAELAKRAAARMGKDNIIIEVASEKGQ